MVRFLIFITIFISLLGFFYNYLKKMEEKNSKIQALIDFVEDQIKKNPGHDEISVKRKKYWKNILNNISNEKNHR
jgi:hypothetical protein